MNISLTPELEQLASLRSEIHAGFEAVDLGEFTTCGPGNIQRLANRVKARGRKRLADEESKRGKR